MKEWDRTVFERFSNPALGDTLKRLGKDPVRKLRRNDRLTGAAILAKKHGKRPKHIIKSASAGLLFEDIFGGNSIREIVDKKGLREAIKMLTGLAEAERDLISAIERSYHAFGLGMKAFNLGFKYERDYHGCGQCALAGVLDTLNIREDLLFKATTTFAGGIGEATDSSCGGYIAVVLAIGSLLGDEETAFSGDREKKYKTASLARLLRERFLLKYGSVTCRDIHGKIFGRVFNLTADEDRKALVKMGAHIDKCTSVVGNASRWTVEILVEELHDRIEYLPIERLLNSL